MDESGFLLEITYGDKTPLKFKVIPNDFYTDKRRHTRRYQEALDIMHQKHIRQKPIREALEWYFYQDRKVPIGEKMSIESIAYCVRSRIVEIKAGRTEETYENRNYIAENVGWYFYLTGADVPPSMLSSRVDSIPKKFGKKKLAWEYPPDCAIELTPIASGPNENSFLLSIGPVNVLLDAGINPEGMDAVQQVLDQRERHEMDAIFISHAHKDHTSALPAIVEKYPDIPIISSQTTLDFFLLQVGYLKEAFPPAIERLITNSLLVKNQDKIRIGDRGDFLQFFFAGHMPGALMLYAEINGFRFLYTGDYTFFDYTPIPGVTSQQEALPKAVDFALVDGSFAHVAFTAPSYQFNFLKDNATLKAQHQNKFLIGADPASTAIIIFNTLHNLFVRAKEAEGLERPAIYMNQKVYEFVRVLCTRQQDLHPGMGNRIKREMNPFQSAIIKWVYTAAQKDQLVQALAQRESGGIVVIFDPPDLDSMWMQEIYKAMSTDPDNAIYLAGPLRLQATADLVAGKDQIFLSPSDTTAWKNQA